MDQSDSTRTKDTMSLRLYYDSVNLCFKFTRCNSNFSHLSALIRIVFLYIGNKHVRLSFISLRLGDCLSGGEHPQDAKFRFNFRGCKRLKIERLLAINVSISYIYIFVITFQINF